MARATLGNGVSAKTATVRQMTALHQTMTIATMIKVKTMVTMKVKTIATGMAITAKSSDGNMLPVPMSGHNAEPS